MMTKKMRTSLILIQSNSDGGNWQLKWFTLETNLQFKLNGENTTVVMFEVDFSDPNYFLGTQFA